jgi:hypothetical protein
VESDGQGCAVTVGAMREEIKQNYDIVYFNHLCPKTADRKTGGFE